MFKNLKGIKFEKINMKLVIAIGIVVILILTAVFIIFRTNLIIDRSNDKKDPDSSQSGNDNSKPGNSDNEGEKPENPDDDKDEPNYDDPKEENNNSTGVSEEAKKRTKKVERLNVEEKKYIIEENLLNSLNQSPTLKTSCEGEKKQCRRFVKNLLYYTNERKYGYVISNCSGYVDYHYDKRNNKFVVNSSGIECKKG